MHSKYVGTHGTFQLPSGFAPKSRHFFCKNPRSAINEKNYFTVTVVAEGWRRYVPIRHITMYEALFLPPVMGKRIIELPSMKTHAHLG